MSSQFDGSLLDGAHRVPAGGGYEPFDLPGKGKPKRDLKKVALMVGLSILAWGSTYTGMLELIQANLGEVGMLEKVAIGLAVAMLQIMIVWLLDQMFSPIHASIKAFYIVGYLFLTLISVGFAFGFYWKVLESRSASTSSAESSIGSVQSALRGAETRLDQLVSTLEALTAISTQKADQESANGNSCPGSKPGAGPRMAMRRGDAEKFSFASNFVKGRSGQVKGDIKTLDTDLQRILKDDKTIVDAKTGTRNDFLKGMGRKLEETTTRYNALRTDPQLRQIRQDAAERAEKTTFPDTKGGTYACPDGQMQSALRGVVAAIDQLPSLEKPKIAATEGSEAVIEAFRRLTMTLAGALQFKLPPTPEELREKQTKAVQAMENPAAAAAAQKAINMEAAGLGKRDYIPLGIAIFVDFCLLMVSFGRPANRFAKTAMELRAAELGPQSAIVGINREVHEDRIIRRNFETFQHVVIHFGNHYLAAVPLTAPKHAPDGRELSAEERERLQIEAQTLVTLFAGLELNSAIVDRGLPPILLLFGGARLVRKRLIKQESKFARAGAFRYYRFRNRAWPEMILGTVMGTAKKYQNELTIRRNEDAVIEKEQRQLDAQERVAANAQRKAENAQRIAEAELRTREAQQRQYAIEEQLKYAAQTRGPMGHRPAGPMQPHLQHSQGPMPPMSMRGAPQPGMAYAGRPTGPAPFGAPHGLPMHGGPMHGGPMHGGPMQSGPAHGGAMQGGLAMGQPAFNEPANHNTAPSYPFYPERGRPPYPASAGSADPRPLPANVVPMPDRSERLGSSDPQASALPSTSMDLAQAAFAQAGQARARGAAAQEVAHNSEPRVLAWPEPATTPVSTAVATSAPEAQIQVPALPQETTASGDSRLTDLGALLRTVAVTQMRAAHHVAEAAHRIEGLGGDAAHVTMGAESQAKTIEGHADRIADAPALMAQAAAIIREPVITKVEPIEVGLTVREHQAWKEAQGTVHADMQRSFAGRGLAHDPGLDDAGSIAARYAPTQRPR
jgi:hypothetical protein